MCKGSKGGIRQGWVFASKFSARSERDWVDRRRGKGELKPEPVPYFRSVCSVAIPSPNLLSTYCRRELDNKLDSTKDGA